MEKQLPKNWIEVQLLDILQTLENGSRPKGGVQGILEGVPSLGGEHLNSNGGFKFGNLKYVPEAFASKMNRGLIKENDILIVKDGATTGKTSFVDYKFPFKLAFVNEHVFISRTFSNINSKAIFYFLNSKLGQERILENFTGSAQGGINQKFANNTLIPLPPLAEQNRMVAKLDTLFAQLETIKASMEKIPVLLKDFRQQVLTQAVTGKLTEEWRKGKELESGLSIILDNRKKRYDNLVKENKKKELKSPKKLDDSEYEEFELSNSYKLPKYWKKSNLKNIADLITDGEHATPKRTEQGYYLLSARNVQNGFISLTNVDYVPKEEYDRIKNRCNPEYKDILISCSGTVGRVSIVPENLEFVMVRSAALIKFQSNTEISKFIEYTLRSDFGQSQILKLQKSTAQANLFLAPIGKIVVPVPSIIEQQEIVSLVESLFKKADVIEEQYKSLKQKIDTLPQAISHKAFKGELTEQLDSDGDAKDLLKLIVELKSKSAKVTNNKVKVKKKNIKLLTII